MIMMPTILFVDDEPQVTSAIKRLLRKEPWRILEASSGKDALAILAREEVDIVVSDELMPGMSGSELLARVCHDYPDTIRMVLTGHASLDAAIRAINEGEIWRFFVKPCQEADLLISIRQALQQRMLLRENRELNRRLHEQTAALRELEAKEPGITQVVRDENGTIVLD
jgi:DNA-binding NtrC family response regulator